MPLHVATHPLISHKMTVLRDSNTHSRDFRRVLKEITFYLGYEATRNLNTDSADVTTPMGVVHNGHKINESISIIPILRAGLGMSDGMMELMPYAAVHHIGTYILIEGLFIYLFYLLRLFILFICVIFAYTYTHICEYAQIYLYFLCI